MVITRTPYRISFFGGGTDYPGWFREHGGAVLATSIDKYCYLTCRNLPPFFEHRYRIVYSKIEDCQRIDQIKHPAVRATLTYMNWDRGIELHHDGDLPARSGMGSSSSFTVGLLNAMRALNGQISSKVLLATESIHIEQNVMHETVGCQDQLAAAYGGLNKFEFTHDGSHDVRPLTLQQARVEHLENHLLLMYTGIRRTASDVAGTYVGDITTKHRQLHTLRSMVDEAISILGSTDDIRRFGELLHESWLMKRSLSPQVSNSDVDDIYAAARAHGAIGGKLLGAGGGGFMLLFAPPESHIAIRTALESLIHVPFRFERSGSQVIFYEPQNDYQSAERTGPDYSRRKFYEIEVGGRQ